MQILIERLNWPVGFVRWQSAKAFASLFSSPQRDLAKKVFLDWLQTRQFEMEVVSGMSVLLFVTPSDLPSADDVGRNINKPSILTDFIFQEIYGQSLLNWLDAHSGPAPSEFHPEKYFEKRQGQAVPLILSKAFEHLQERTGYPFMEQWAFEWRKLMDKTNAPYSTYPYHFMDKSISREGISGEFHLNQDSVYRSAFLRTLAFAVQKWNVFPSDLVEFAAHCLPLRKNLHLIHPIKRPLWLKDVPEKCCQSDSSLEKLTRKIIKADIGSKGMRPVFLMIPISNTIAEFGELSIESFFVTSDFVPKPEFADECQDLMYWPIMNLIEDLLPEEDMEKYRISGMAGSCIPVCLNAWAPAIGFWQNNYTGTGLVFPAPYVFDKPLHVEPTKGWLGFISARKRIGQWKTWNDNWIPIYPNGGRPRYGILTEIKTVLLNESAKRLGMSLAWRVKLKLWERKTTYGPPELIARSLFFRD